MKASCFKPVSITEIIIPNPSDAQNVSSLRLGGMDICLKTTLDIFSVVSIYVINK